MAARYRVKKIKVRIYLIKLCKIISGLWQFDLDLDKRVIWEIMLLREDYGPIKEHGT